MSKQLQRSLNNLVNPATTKIVGSLGLSEDVVEVPGRNGFVYVRVLDNLSEAVHVYNDKVAPIYDLPVEIKYLGGRWEIVGRDSQRYQVWKTTSTLVGKHGGSHSAVPDLGGGSDVVWVDERQFVPFLVMPVGKNGSKSVKIAKGTYFDVSGSMHLGGNTGTSYDDSLNGTFLMMMDDQTGHIYHLTGTTSYFNTTGTSSLVPGVPKIPQGNYDHPLAAIHLVSGSPIGWNNILDAREFVHTKTPSVAVTGSSGGGSGLTYVSTDATLTGDGTVGSPLSVVGGGGGGGSSHTYVGNNSAGSADETYSIGYAYIKKITLTTDGLLSNVAVLMKGDAGHVGNFSGVVYADSAGSPGKLLVAPPPIGNYNIFLNSTYGWVTFPTGIWLTAGDYWIGVYAYTAANYYKLSKVAGGSDRVVNVGNAWVPDADMYGSSSALADYSIRGSVIT